MGLFADIKAMKEVAKIKKGQEENLSISQVTGLITNMMDSKNNLDIDTIKTIEQEVKECCEQYKNTSEDQYDFWNEHIKYVYKESIKLAQKYNADINIVSLGALLHGIALIKKVGDRKNHHSNGAILAKEIFKDKYEIIKTVVIGE